MKTLSLSLFKFFFIYTYPSLCTDLASVPSLVESFLLSFKGKVAEMFINGDKWLENELSVLNE